MFSCEPRAQGNPTDGGRQREGREEHKYPKTQLPKYPSSTRVAWVFGYLGTWVLGYLSPSPNHHDVGRERAAHVEGQHALGAFDLALTRRAGELSKHFRDLPHARGSDWMAVAY